MATKQRRKHFARSIRQGRVAANTVKLSSSERELLAIPKTDWAIAKRQERIVKVALRTNIEEAADRAGRSTRTVNRLLARYRVNPTLLAFLPRKRGQAVGSRRLDPAREAIVEEAVDKWMASREPLPVSRAVEEAIRLVKAAGLKSVARNSITRRLMSAVAVPIADNELNAEIAPTLRRPGARLGSCRPTIRPSI